LHSSLQAHKNCICNIFFICFTLVSCFTYFLTLKMEATCSSETSVVFQWTTQHYILEDRTLQLWCWYNNICNFFSYAIYWLPILVLKMAHVHKVWGYICRFYDTIAMNIALRAQPLENIIHNSVILWDFSLLNTSILT
jgi:hypothetical protein